MNNDIVYEELVKKIPNFINDKKAFFDLFEKSFISTKILNEIWEEY